MPNLSRPEAEALLGDLHRLITEAGLARRDILDTQPSGSIVFTLGPLAAALSAVDDSLARLDKKGVVPRVRPVQRA